jgi:serine/threonine protein phosphatase PrpC
MLKPSEQAQKTDTGKQRHANEDSYYARAPLFAVADGMGGAQAGEVASSIAVRAFERGFTEEGSPEGELKDLFKEANQEIHELAQRDSSRAGMGTTLTAAVVGDDEVSFAHVGDSRAYVLRDGELKRLTKDHSLVEELRRQGRLTDEQAEEHPQRSVITRALGPEESVKVDTMTFPAREGDVFLLCSDGLTTMVGEDEIKRVLTESRSLRSAVSKLIDTANRQGGRDNITVVAFKLEEAEDRAAAEEEPDEGATLVARTAEQAGITAERMRAAAGRLRPGQATPTPRRLGRRAAIATLIGLLVLAGLFFGARQIYFLGTDEGGRVAVFRGLPYDLPFGIDLYSEQESIPVQIDVLTPERQDVVTDHKLRSHDDASDILEDIDTREGAQPPVPPVPTTPAQPAPKKKGGGGKKKPNAQ